MRHSILSWDCCFRNFFDLIPALAAQDYPRSEYELIIVEQRTRQESDRYNHALGLPSLSEVVDEHRGRFNVEAVFLGVGADLPYHIGLCLNRAAARARGSVLSRMDGDVIVRPDFLSQLDQAHSELETTLNLDRRMVPHPVGASLSNWREGKREFVACLQACPDRDRPVPKTVSNKGPMVSAPRDWIEAVGGYDEHRLWSTALSRSGQDLTARLEILTGKPSMALPDQFCVHPFHPSVHRSSALAGLVLGIQRKLINWSKDCGEPHHERRQAITEQLYRRFAWAVEASIRGGPSIRERAHAYLLMRSGRYPELFA